ncbi:MAG: hypothetical protein NVSMB20_17420 [Bradyrhizobium sp.]
MPPPAREWAIHDVVARPTEQGGVAFGLVIDLRAPYATILRIVPPPYNAVRHRAHIRISDAERPDMGCPPGLSVRIEKPCTVGLRSCTRLGRAPDAFVRRREHAPTRIQGVSDSDEAVAVGPFTEAHARS